MIDYNAAWNEAMAVHGLANLYEQTAQAARYDASDAIRRDGAARAAALPVGPADTVLDIGSGPGTLTLPLAHRVRRVTAVEPSAAMRAHLARRAREEGLANIRILPARWEDLAPEDAGVHDVVIASYSLNMRNIVPALRKMDALARRRVFLYWFAGEADWERMLHCLRPAVGLGPFFPQPKSDMLYGALCSMGLSPAVRPLEDTSFGRDYASMDDAVADLRRRVGTESGAHDDVLRAYIRAHFAPLAGGGWRFADKTHYVELSWAPARAGEGSV